MIVVQSESHRTLRDLYWRLAVLETQRLRWGVAYPAALYQTVCGRANLDAAVALEHVPPHSNQTVQPGAAKRPIPMGTAALHVGFDHKGVGRAVAEWGSERVAHWRIVACSGESVQSLYTMTVQ